MVIALRSKIDFTASLFLLNFCFTLINCNNTLSDKLKNNKGPYIIILGICQDGGYPQAGTKKSEAWDDLSKRRHVSCLAIVDPQTSQRWLIDATPDFKEQLHFLDNFVPVPDTPGLTGIFLTHAHIGHYTGLMHLGREAIGAQNVPVYAMPKMYEFLSHNGPWDLLVRLKNIKLLPLSDQACVKLNDKISIMPFLVPHRAEYTETVGYRIDGPNKSVLFISDIDKWEDWDQWGIRIEDKIKEADVAYLDGTFYADGEIPGRSMYDIPHPFIEESMKRFGLLPLEQKMKIRFIHLNRTNPALISGSDAQKAIEKAGFRVAKELEIVEL
jgi:pyrroloquinoline quinone biosynthesis protein B